MVIKKFLILCVTVVNCFSANAAGKGDVNTPEAVVRFISNVEKLSNLSNEDEEIAILLRDEMKKCFAGKDVYGINIDKASENNSEFPYLGLSTVSNSTTYCMNLYKYIFKERILKLSHQSMDTEVINFIGEEGKAEKYFYSTTIKKICKCNGEVKELWQVFEVPCGENVNKVINSLKVYEKEPKIIIKEELKKEIENYQELTEQQFLNRAARYYTEKNYEGAFSMLKKMTEIYDANAEGWFKLALLVYYEEKCFKNIYSNPKEVAKSFMKKAEDRAKGEFKTKISNRLKRWEYRRYMQ